MPQKLEFVSMLGTVWKLALHKLFIYICVCVLFDMINSSYGVCINFLS